MKRAPIREVCILMKLGQRQASNGEIWEENGKIIYVLLKIYDNFQKQPFYKWITHFTKE